MGKRFRFTKIFTLILVISIFSISIGDLSTVLASQTEKAGKLEKVDDKYYYYSQNDSKYVFEKVSHPDRGPGEVDGLLDTEDARSQSYAWSAIEHGDYIYIGTCYNSTYGIYWRNVRGMMKKLGKTDEQAAEIARNFVQFIFNDRFDETLRPKGVLVKFDKRTDKFSLVYDSKNDSDPEISGTNCSGYRMAIERNGKLYFVSLGSPTMFLLEVTPGDGDSDVCKIVQKRTLSSEGMQKQIASGVHGLINYDNEVIMAYADEEKTWPDGTTSPEGGLIIASSDMENWRVIADNNDFDGLPGYHNYDGLYGGGVWDIIEYNGHLYVTVVTDLTDPETGITAKRGFAMYRGTKGSDGNFTWTQVVGDVDAKGAKYPYGLGTTVSMACNLWIYNGNLYMGTYNDPMIDLAEVPARGNFEPLYNDLNDSISLYRMDSDENIELVGGKTNDIFTERKGNLGVGLGNNSNQYVWRMVENDDKLWLGTYDTSTLTYAFTQLTDGQLVDMSVEEYNNRLDQLSRLLKSLDVIKDEDEAVFKAVFGSDIMRELFNSSQKIIDDGIGSYNPVEDYDRFVEDYKEFKDRITAYEDHENPKVKKLIKEINEKFLLPADGVVEDMKKAVYYFGVNHYSKKAVPGFDLMVTEDGLNFEIVTDDGFGDESNHGVRTLTSANAGESLYVGTANPFNGAQLWRSTDKLPEQSEPESKLKINFKPGVHGKFEKDEKVEYELDKGQSVPDVPKVRANSGWKHHGWKIMNENKIYSTDDILSMKFDSSTDIVAVYRYVGGSGSSVPSDNVTKINVRFEKGESGELVGQTEFSIVQGTKLKTIPAIVVDEGYVFNAWRNKEDGKMYTSEEIMSIDFAKDTTFVAEYDKDIFHNKPYIKGYPDGTFQPDGKITREEVVTIFDRIIKEDAIKEVNSSKEFSDLKNDRWSYESINKLSKMDIINGYPDGSFKPAEQITRAEFVKIVSKFIESSNSGKKFPDVDDDHWAKEAIELVYSKGLIKGYPDGNFMPQNNLTRAEAVSIINKLIRRECGSNQKPVYKGDFKEYTDLDNMHWAYELILKASNDFECESK